MTLTKERVDVYSLVTNQIIEQLENSVVPWLIPWVDTTLPQNLVTRMPYRGINLLLLGSLRYEQNLFLTFNQAKDIGASIKKGSKGHLIVFWKPLTKDTDEGDKSIKFVLKYYKVFNISQCDNIPEKYSLASEHIAFSPIAECERMIEEMNHCPNIVYEEQQAFYNPVKDFINMPTPKNFISEQRFYSTLFHELIHSTGHEKRLARKGITELAHFGSPLYSLEELTAEIGSCFLSSLCGIAENNLTQSVSYIKGWLEALKNDKRLIIQASAQAQKATDYILNVPNVEEALV